MNEKNPRSKLSLKGTVIIISAIIVVMVTVIIAIILNSSSDGNDIASDIVSVSEPSSSSKSSVSSTTAPSSSSAPSESKPAESNVDPIDSEVQSSASEVTASDAPVPPEKVTEIYDFKFEFSVPAYEKKSFYDDVTGNSLPYCLFLPEDYTSTKEYPVILFLHGAGERGDDNISQIQNFTDIYLVNGDLAKNAIVICPQCPSNGWWNIDLNTYGDEKGWLGITMRLLQNVQDNYSCDSDRIYVTGLSMGGQATWSLLERYSDIFAAGVPVCGWGDTSKGDILAEIPIWIYHGTADNTVSFSSSQSMYNAIINAGGDKVRFTRLQGVGHNAWDYAYVDREMVSWMFAQDKSADFGVEYEYVPYFRITDFRGNTVICDDDISDSFYYFNVDYTVNFTIELKEDGVEKLKAAYPTSGGKPFTVNFGEQKIFSFTATKEPIDEYFVIDNVFTGENVHIFDNILRLIKQTRQ